MPDEDAEINIEVDMGGGRAANVPMELPSNSKYRRKPDSAKKEKPEKVITGEVILKKKGLGTRLKDSFISGEGADGLADFIMEEVLIPKIKMMLGDVVNQGLDRLMWGAFKVRSSSDRPGGYTSYNQVSQTRRYRPAQTQFGVMNQRARAVHDFSDLIFPSRGDAELILDGMIELVERYGQVSVADFYSLAGVTPDFPDNDWGWDNLETASVRPIRGGYMITLPRTRPIESR